MTFPHRCLRTAAVTAIAAAALGFGPATLVPAAAAPVERIPVSGPFDGLDGGAPDAEPHDKRAEKAEKFGGELVTEVIDLITGVVTCGLNIATDSVKCRL
ncbi:hypothetical protein [Nocardia arizonensis]|uniref:hypothetical protein n=1 Tax=Nocardia arizonensis TaxID=1141647 RepID=UPI0006D03BF1|nr:hypothetical protein [Nocardia arizonensis]